MSPSPESSVGDVKPFRVLSLDGGGMRGSYAATYLWALANGYAKRRNVAALDMGGAFDLIVGTSTGGIIACALAKGVPLPAIIELYKRHGREIFPRRLPAGALGFPGDLRKRRGALAAGTNSLRGVLEHHFGDTTLERVYVERGIALAVTAVEMSQHRSWVFKTPHLPEEYYRDGGYRLVDVCLATSAAPIYRSLAAVDYPDGAAGHHVFADGGLWANNPVLVALIEALRMAEKHCPIEVFCLGTCSCPGGEQILRSDLDRGLLDWKFGGSALGLSLDAQEFAYDNMAKMLARHLDRPCSIVRFPREPTPSTLMSYLEIDDARDEAIDALIRQARNDADMASSRCNAAAGGPDRLIDTLFRDAPHIAGTVTPCALQPSLP